MLSGARWENGLKRSKCDPCSCEARSRLAVLSGLNLEPGTFLLMSASVQVGGTVRYPAWRR